MAVLTWVTRADPQGRNDFSGRWINMSTADSAAAIANGWGSANPLEWKATDAAVISARDANADLGAVANWYEKMQDAKYSVAADDLGSYTPPTGGAFTNITPTPNPLTVTQAGGLNASCGTVAASGGNSPVTWSITPSNLWNMSGNTVRKSTAGTSGYTLGSMSVTIKATGSDGESFSKTMNINVT